MKEELEKNLNDALINTYLSNMMFLKEYDNELYQRLEALSSLINTGEYEERYALEFIKESGDFDIYDIKMDLYLYNKKPKIINNKIVNKINLDTNAHFTSFVPSMFSGYTFNFEFDPEVDLQESKFATFMLQNDVKKYLDILGKPIFKEKKLKKVDKFMFIGTLLGRHMFKIARKIKAKQYFVCESNLEIFRLSLFVFDLLELAKQGSLVLSIMDEKYDFYKKVSDFLAINFIHNHTIKYYTTNYKVEDYFSQIANALSNSRPTAFTYNMILFNVLRNNVEKLDKYSFIDFSKAESFKFFKDKSVLFVAAGPSLDDNILWLKNNQKKFFIITVAAALKRFKENNIIPDVVVTLDASYISFREKQFTDEMIEFINKNDILLFASSMTSERILELIKKENIFIYEVLGNLKYNNKLMGGDSVGDVGFKILLNLNVNKIFLLGTDLALNQKDGHSHIKTNTSRSKTFDLNLADEFSHMQNGKISDDDLIECKGNIETKVWTMRKFFSILDSYNSFLRDYDREVDIYNLSNHGVYINKTIPKKVEDLDMEDFSLLKKENLKEKFINISFTKLDKRSLEIIEEEIVLINEVLSYIKNQKASKDYEEFLEKISFLFSEVNIKSKFKYFSRFFQNYLYLINTYIDFHFNDKKYKKSKLKKVEELWFNEIETLIQKYKKLLQKAK